MTATPLHPYVGMWETADRRIRHQLLPNGRYDEARGRRESAYQGRYEVSGDHIEYWDDTGFTADGDLSMMSCTMPAWFSIAGRKRDAITTAHVHCRRDAFFAPLDHRRDRGPRCLLKRNMFDGEAVTFVVNGVFFPQSVG